LWAWQHLFRVSARHSFLQSIRRYTGLDRHKLLHLSVTRKKTHPLTCNAQPFHYSNVPAERAQTARVIRRGRFRHVQHVPLNRGPPTHFRMLDCSSIFSHVLQHLKLHLVHRDILRLEFRNPCTAEIT